MAKSDNGELNNSNLASNNSDPNNSLLQKVTKRVSGLFPSSISKWFGPSEGSTSVIRRRDTEDDDEQLQIQQPPKKRARSTADVEFSTSSNHFQMTSTPLLNSRHLQPGPSGYSRHILYDAGDGPSTSRSQQLLNGDDKSEKSERSERSEKSEKSDKSGKSDKTGKSEKSAQSEKSDKSESGESTSGYSSVLVQQNKERGFVSDRGHGIHQPSTSKDTGTPSPNKSQNTSLNSSRSLFSDQSLTNPQRQCLSARRPSFNSSTFGSPTFVDRTLSTKRAVNSPFYGGRTIYGGASAYKRNRMIFPRDEANNIQVKNSVNIKPVNNEPTASNENVCLSKTARRILDTLEHFSTPVLDAKKIPNINRQTMNKRLTPYARENAPKPSAPNRELIIPTVPDLLKMKQKERLQNSTEQVRKLATTSKSVLNSEYSIRTLSEDESTKPQKHTSKIKAKIATVREKKNQLHDTIDAVKLPEIQLPITSLPKFDFTLPTPPPAVVQKTKHVDVKKTPTKVNSDRYKFAKPIVVDCDTTAVTSINHFKFSEPIDAKTTTSSVKGTKIHETNIKETTKETNIKQTNIKENTKVTPLAFKAGCSTAPRKKEQKNNGQNNVGFALKPPEKLSEGSVMDILGKPDSLMDKFKPVSGTWECLSCMVRNIPTATRCVACETLKEPVKKQETKPAVNNFGNQFKMTAEKWECSACMVRNNNSETKCVACTTPRTSPAHAPTSKPATTPSIFGGFGDKFKPATDTWECGACMIRNKNDAVKCVACETPKPGAVKDTKPSLVMRLPDAPASSGFTDLIKKQQTNWECPSCMVRNPPEKKTCACCEGPKPGEKQEFKFGAGATQFKFGIDKATASTSTAAASTVAASGSGFSFGGNATTPATTFSFGVKPPANTVDSKPGFTFGVPAATTPTTQKTETPAMPTPSITTAAVNTADVAKTSTTPSFSFGLPIQTTSTTVVLNGEPKKMFSFGTQSTTITSSTNSTTKPTNIFNPVTISATTTKPAAISTPSVSNSTVSSTSIATPTTTGAAAASSSTTFSFGATPTENKKPSTSVSTPPQFNFGSGSSTPTFNPVFGSNVTPKTTTSTFVQPNTNFLTTTTTAPQTQNPETNQNQTGFSASFTFKSNSSITTNNNKTEVKPFSFASTPKTETPKGGKFPEFSFSPSTANTTAAIAPTGPLTLTKVPVMNFAANSASTDAAQKPPSSLFSFGAKTESKPPGFGGGGMFGQSVQQTPQNGGFNFGATAVTPNFNFGAGAVAGAAGAGAATASSTTTPVFGFGTSQAGSGSATAASAPGLFTFGGGAPAQQPTTAAFTPDIKPNFNFSGGTSIGTFSAQGGPSTTMPQRKIRKAMRRTHPR